MRSEGGRLELAFYSAGYLTPGVVVLALLTGGAAAFTAEGFDDASRAVRWGLAAFGILILIQLVQLISSRQERWRERLATAAGEAWGEALGIAVGAALGMAALFQWTVTGLLYAAASFETRGLGNHLKRTVFTVPVFVVLGAAAALVAALTLARIRKAVRLPE